MSENSLTSKNMTFSGNDDGLLKWSEDDRFFACGGATNHPRASSINVRDYISFRQNGLTADSDESNEIGHIGTNHTTGLMIETLANGNNITISAHNAIILKNTSGDNSIEIQGSKINLLSDIQVAGHDTKSETFTFQTGTLQHATLTFTNGLLTY